MTDAEREHTEAWVLGAHLRAIARLLVESGDITPWGVRLIEQSIAQHLPGVVWDDGGGDGD